MFRHDLSTRYFLDAILAFAPVEMPTRQADRATPEEARSVFANAREVNGPLGAADDEYFTGQTEKIDALLGTSP